MTPLMIPPDGRCRVCILRSAPEVIPHGRLLPDGRRRDAAPVLNIIGARAFVRPPRETASAYRVTLSGPTGLDYTAIPVVMDMLGIEAERRAECFDGVRTMEGEALSVFASRREHGG